MHFKLTLQPFGIDSINRLRMLLDSLGAGTKLQPVLEYTADELGKTRFGFSLLHLGVQPGFDSVRDSGSGEIGAV